MSGESVKEKLASIIRKSLLTYGARLRSPGEIYVTEAVNCPRRVFFNIKFNAYPLSDSKAALVGRALHELLPRMLKEAFPGARFEVPVRYSIGGGWSLVGRIDMLYDNQVFEFKFTSNYPYTEAKLLYMQQANTYAVMAGAEKWYIVSIDRNSLVVDIDEGEPDKKMFEALLSKISKIIYSLQKDIVPAGPDLEWECKYCPYSIICQRWKEWLLNKELKI